MAELNEYRLVVTVQSDEGERHTYEYDEVSFSTREEGYGNKTYLYINEDNYFDIRYDADYDASAQIAYLADWADRRWSGKYGSWKLVDLHITRK